MNAPDLALIGFVAIIVIILAFAAVVLGRSGPERSNSTD